MPLIDRSEVASGSRLSLPHQPIKRVRDDLISKSESNLLPRAFLPNRWSENSIDVASNLRFSMHVTRIVQTCFHLSRRSPSSAVNAKSFSFRPRSQFITRTMATAMGKRLEGKTVLVTGASSGIGKSTGLGFLGDAVMNL